MGLPGPELGSGTKPAHRAVYMHVHATDATTINTHHAFLGTCECFSELPDNNNIIACLGLLMLLFVKLEKFHSFCKSTWMHHQEQRMVGLSGRWRRRFVKLSDLSWLRLILTLCTLQKVLMKICFSDAGDLLAPTVICLTMNSALTNSVSDWHLWRTADWWRGCRCLMMTNENIAELHGARSRVAQRLLREPTLGTHNTHTQFHRI